MGLFSRKPKCQHDWKIIEATTGYEGDGNIYWERYHDVTNLRGFCKSCGTTNTWKIANWRMNEEQVRDYVREIYGQ